MLKTLGDWAVTNSKAELIDAKMFLLVGTNMPETHPVLSYDLHIAVRTRDARMVIICAAMEQPLRSRDRLAASPTGHGDRRAARDGERHRPRGAACRAVRQRAR